MKFAYSILALVVFAATALAQPPGQPPQWGFPDKERVPKVTFAAAQSADADWGTVFVKAAEAHAKNPLAKGDKIKVAVLDNGAQVSHPAFGNRIKGIYNAVTRKEGKVDDGDHGTHCASTVLHVAPNVDLYIVQVLTGQSGGVDDIAHGIDYAITKWNVDVISMSLGGSQADTWIPPVLKKAEAAGVLVICAAGNDGPGENTEGYPGRYPESISIAAHDRNRLVANFSSRGPNVFACLPGVDITAAWPDDRQATISGTSMATPHAAGAAASWIACNPVVGKKLRPALFRAALQAALSRPSQRTTASGYGSLDLTKLIPSSGLNDPIPVPLSFTVSLADFSPEARKRFEDAGIAAWTLTITPKGGGLKPIVPSALAPAGVPEPVAIPKVVVPDVPAPAPPAPQALPATKPNDPQPLGTSPGPNFKWRSLPGIGFGWVQDGIESAPAPQPATTFPTLRSILMPSQTCPGNVFPTR